MSDKLETLSCFFHVMEETKNFSLIPPEFSGFQWQQSEADMILDSFTYQEGSDFHRWKWPKACKFYFGG